MHLREIGAAVSSDDREALRPVSECGGAFIKDPNACDSFQVFCFLKEKEKGTKTGTREPSIWNTNYPEWPPSTISEEKWRSFFVVKSEKQSSTKPFPFFSFLPLLASLLAPHPLLHPLIQLLNPIIDLLLPLLPLTNNPRPPPPKKKKKKKKKNEKNLF